MTLQAHLNTIGFFAPQNEKMVLELTRTIFISKVSVFRSGTEW